MKFNAAAERVVLACLFQGGHEAYCEVADLLTPEMFVADNKNSVYYKCLQYILKDTNAKVDIGTFFAAAKTLGFYDLLNTAEEQVFIRSLINSKTEQSNLLRNAAIIVKLKAINDAVKLHEKIASKMNELSGDETLDEILSISEKPVLDFATSLGMKNNEIQHIAHNVDSFLEEKIKNPVSFMGIPTGFYRYDNSIGGGLRPGVHLVGARPKVGKTFLADNICVNVSRLSIPCLNLDTEMDEQSHLVRIISRISKVKMSEIESGSFASDGAKYRRVMEAKEELKSIPYYYKSIAGMQPEEILSYMRRWLHKHVGFVEGKQAKDCLIVYDYIKLMDAKAIKHNISEFQALGFLITNLHNFTVEYKVPVLAFNQLNREGIDREDGAANSGSDRLLWLCTSNSIYKRKSAEESAEERGDDNIRYSHKLIVTDTRYGPGLDSGDYININANYAFGSISEGQTRNEIMQQNQTLRVTPEDGEISV